MKQDFDDFELDDWDGIEDEVIYESEEFANEFEPEETLSRLSRMNCPCCRCVGWSSIP